MLGICLVAIAVTLNVSWLILNWREGVLAFFGFIFFLLIIAGLLGWALAAALLVGVKSLLLNNLQQYFSYNVGLSATDLVEVIVLAMCVGVLLCGVTSFLTLRRYLRV